VKNIDSGKEFQSTASCGGFPPTPQLLCAQRPAGGERIPSDRVLLSGQTAFPSEQEIMKMDHTTHTPLAAFELNEANLLDAVIYGPMDEKIGSVSHVHTVGATTQVIVDVGGFLGIGAKPVALAITDLNFMRDDSGTVHATTTWTKDQIKALPEHMH
jgi:hypothetical protein